MLLNQNCVIVDLETTGANSRFGRITEFGCLQCNVDGSDFAFEQLINPNQNIPANITRITGISNTMLVDKPSFEDLASQLATYLSDRIFIAHNVRFDYGFLKSGFSMCEMTFKPKLLCTVKLGRQLYPQWPSHSLSNICKQINYHRDISHRAMADVLATKAFIDFAIEDKGLEAVNNAAAEQLKRPTLPKDLDAAEFEAVANTSGVYRFFDANNTLLYVGKSKNMRQRLLSHFQNDVKESRAMQMTQQISRLETTITGGELSALLLENTQIKQGQPIFNRRQRRTSKLWCIHLQQHNEYHQLKVEASLPGDTESDSSFGFYRTKKQANKALEDIIKDNKLCQTINAGGTAEKLTPCFARQLKRCKGACEKKENATLYNLRVQLAIKPFQNIAWPYAGPIAIIEENREHHIVSISYIDQWACLRSVTFNSDSQDSDQYVLLESKELKSIKRIFDKDMYHVIKNAFKEQLRIIEMA
jgi:DNA polymerase-3 subunit epsilon